MLVVSKMDPKIYLEEEDLSKISYFLNNILESKGIKINPEWEDDFIKEHDFYNDEELAKHLKLSKEKLRGYLEWLARLELGEKILKCV